MGYEYKKVNKRKILIESSRLQSLKIKFLRKYLQYEEQNALFVFWMKRGYIKTVRQ
jgi:hypothetical protein